MVAEEGFRNNAQMGAAACVALLCCATAATLPAREATPAGLQVRLVARWWWGPWMYPLFVRVAMDIAARIRIAIHIAIHSAVYLAIRIAIHIDIHALLVCISTSLSKKSSFF